MNAQENEISYERERTSARIGLFLLGFCVLLFGACVYQWTKPEGRMSCRNFSTWSDAETAYNAGATYLDGNDKDGIPCESLRA